MPCQTLKSFFLLWNAEGGEFTGYSFRRNQMRPLWEQRLLSFKKCKKCHKSGPYKQRLYAYTLRKRQVQNCHWGSTLAKCKMCDHTDHHTGSLTKFDKGIANDIWYDMMVFSSLLWHISEWTSFLNDKWWMDGRWDFIWSIENWLYHCH